MQGLWLLFVLVAGFSSSQLVYSQEDWNYENNGPNTWPITYPTCNGNRQSPVDVTNLVLTDLLPELDFDGHWSNGAQATLTNNGYSAEATFRPRRNPPTLSGGPLNGDYIFSNVHFHWGVNNTVGSEHTLAGRSFSMEAHVVHYKKEYRNVTNASRFPDGLAVVAFFLQQGNSTNRDLVPLIAALSRITNYQSSTNIALRVVTQWFYDIATVDNYFTYPGSLTTPPCSQAVTWIIYRDPVSISRDQVARFRTLRTPTGSLLLTNYRPTQNLNNRTVVLPL